MYPDRRRTLSLALALTALCAAPLAALANAADPDRTLSPYFHIPDGDPDTDQLPLESTRAEVSIAGVIADVTVVQVYKNDGEKPINARYVFPASTRAAVHGMKMTVGDRVIKAVVKERERARREYEQARREGKSASLLEQQRPNVFSMEVANIMPGDRIEVELAYTELLVPTDGVYELVYPTVVGPRYSNDTAASAPDDDWVESPYTRSGQAPTYDFDLRVTVDAGLPLAALSSPTHQVDIDWKDRTRAGVSLKPSESDGGNRDFVLRYKLAGDKVASGLMLYEGANEKFFLLMVQPPARVTPAEIPPREYVFIVDVSGSMNGFPLDVTKKLMRELAAGLRPVDRFNVILFSGASQIMSPTSVEATKDNLDKALWTLDRIQGGGSTQLLPALETAMDLPQDGEMSRSFVVITDGYISADAEVFDYIRNNLGEANVFTFGIGSSINRHLIEGMAAAGMGEPFAVTDSSEAPGVASRFAKYIGAPVLTNVKVETDGFRAFDLAPMSIPDVLADRPIIVKGKWTGAASGTIRVSGIGGRGAYSQSFDVGATPVSKSHRALAYLWARTRIAELSDFASPEDNETARQEIIALGLAYNLLTRYTSFIAVHDVVRNADGTAKNVDQPLPMPEGVSDRAVGPTSMAVGSEPGLALLALLLAFLGGLALLQRRRWVR
jgi:Ca-activated chloride channel homolog